MPDKQISLLGKEHPSHPRLQALRAEGSIAPTHIEAPPVKSHRGKAIRQITASFIANIGPMNTGLIFGFSAVCLPQLAAPSSEISVDKDQASWIASLSSLSTPIGCILGGYLSDKIGRKKTLILTEFPLILGWLIISLARNVEMIYAGRLLCGLGSGIVGAPARVYTSEITQPHLRGMLTALSSVALSFGVLFQYTLGAFMSWKMISAISCLVPLTALILMCLLPETPNYLISRQQPEKAARSLAKIRSSSYNLMGEINQLQEFADKINAKKTMTLKETFQALTEPSCLKPFLILTVYFMLYQFSGVNVVTFYAVKIFQDSGASMDKNTATIILGVLRFLFTIVGCAALRKCGRRPLSFISGVGCAITMIGLGIYLYYKRMWELQGIEPMYTYIPVACIFLFIVTCTVGFLVVPWIMIGELYPMKVRGLVGGCTTAMAHSFVFIVVKTFPGLCDLVQPHGAFILYGTLSVAATIFFYFFLPETKGRTLQEIEDYFSGRIKSLKPPTANNNISTLNNLNNHNNNNNHIVLSMENDKLIKDKQSIGK